MKNVTLNLLLELVIAVFLVIVIVIVNYPTLAVGSGKSQRVAAVSVTVSHTVGQLTLPRYSVLTTLLPTHAARRYPLQHYL